MKIVLMEPLGIEKDTLVKLAEKLSKQGHEFVAYDSFSTDPEELKKRSEDADALIIANHPLPGEVIRADKKLKFISVAFVGIDHVDLEACKENDIKISNTGGYCNDAVAELAIGLTLDCLRNISAGNEAVQAGKGKGGLQGRELADKTVGIVGTGAIGCRTAEIFKAFGCKLIGFSRSQKPAARALGLEYKSLDEVMQEADIVSLHTPLTPETKGLIGQKEIGEMKEGAILINTSRGPVVDTGALAAALKEGRIKAGLDVFDQDPPLSADYPLLGLPNLVCTPHVGFDTKESIDRRAEMAFENVTAWLDGQQVRIML
ncbi:2-hydroxyacid dehydrogenase [Lactobacillus sp.]|uniref:2-hydroxyacid dehydrogenase n=1 Tax=Lactobacillus sp. TaxID=1591 RepID=UPI003F0A91F2